MSESSAQKADFIELHVIIKGHVQGVGFRATVSRLAKQFKLVGTVCNLADGAVEIFVQGDRKDILKLFTALKQEFGTRHISQIDQEPVTLQNHYEGFNIIP